jgi:hypothetical protein
MALRSLLAKECFPVPKHPSQGYTASVTAPCQESVFQPLLLLVFFVPTLWLHPNRHQNYWYIWAKVDRLELEDRD